jgi:drug/metabolite transporter (DMT)-like permease
MIGTSIVYIALNLTTASSYQMLRGSVIIFTGLLSVAFIGRTIRRYMWVGMACITTGLILVGVGDFAFQDTGSSDYSENKLNGIVAGDLLIIMAQIVAAAQFVYEEKYIKKHSIPALLAVGLEGLFGMVILSLLLIPMYYIPASKPFSTDPENRLENIFDAFEQMKNNWHIVLATVGGILSIALFNFSGISITKEMSATTRMVIDSCRTIIIWVVSLSLVWQVFNYKSFLLQLLGFFFLFLGMIIYNDIFFRPLLKKYHLIKPRKPDPDDFEPGPAGERDDDEGSLAGDENPLIINAEDMARRNILV